MEAQQTIAITAAIALALGGGFMAGRMTAPEQAASQPLKTEGGPSIESALQRIESAVKAAETAQDAHGLSKDARDLADYERHLRLADEAAADARLLGASEAMIEESRRRPFMTDAPSDFGPANSP